MTVVQIKCLFSLMDELICRCYRFFVCYVLYVSLSPVIDITPLTYALGKLLFYEYIPVLIFFFCL